MILTINIISLGNINQFVVVVEMQCVSDEVGNRLIYNLEETESSNSFMGDHVVSIDMQLLISVNEDFCGNGSFLVPFIIRYCVFNTGKSAELSWTDSLK